MMMSSPEVTAMAQTLQPTVPLFNIIEGYQDIQTVVAVLETQQSFAVDQNTARFKGGDGPLEIPDENEKIRYLGYILTQSINLKRPLKIQLQFASRYAWTPLVLMLRSFGLQGQRKIRITQGLTFHQDSLVNAAGLANFEFKPFDDWIKNPERVTGFLVYLIRPPGERQIPVEEEQELSPEEEGIIRSAMGLNVYRRIDTRA